MSHLWTNDDIWEILGMNFLEEGPLRKILRERKLLKQTYSGSVDISEIDRFIRDENSDVEKYNSVARYLKHPEARALALQIGLDEMHHRTLWQDLKAKLEREMERP